MEQQATTREELARKDAELSSLHREKEGLDTELALAQSANKHLQDRLKATEEAFNELQADKDILAKQIQELEQQVCITSYRFT